MPVGPRSPAASPLRPSLPRRSRPQPSRPHTSPPHPSPPHPSPPHPSPPRAAAAGDARAHVVDGAGVATRAGGDAREVVVDGGVARADGHALTRDRVLLHSALAHGADIGRAVGGEPLITARERARVDDVVRRAPPAVIARVAALVRSLDGAVARAVLLRAVSARARPLIAGDGAPLRVLARFTEKLAPLDADEIRRRASVLDRFPTENDRALDPQALWNKRGTTHAVARDDVDAANDGLIQRFTASCGPTTLQMMLAEADPVFAFAVFEHGLASTSAADPVARFQRALLEAHGGTAIGRVEAFDRARLRNLLGRLAHAGALDAAGRDALRRHALAGAPLTPVAHHALDVVRAHANGFPGDAALARLHEERWPERDSGIDTAAMMDMVHTHITPRTGVRYRAISFARGQAWRHVDEVAAALKRGVDVAVGVSEPGHWMLASAVKGRRPRRAFLISDPDGGRTAWVLERDFARASFCTEPFHLPAKGERPYVDTLLLPERP